MPQRHGYFKVAAVPAGKQEFTHHPRLPCREDASTLRAWTDSEGNFWLYGGWGYDANVSEGPVRSLSDLWEFTWATTKQWVFQGGNSTGNQYPSYGPQGSFGGSYNPGGRGAAVSWTGKEGNLWLFGGGGEYNTSHYLNDLWEYNPSKHAWAWMGGGQWAPVNGVDQGFNLFGIYSPSTGMAGSTYWPGSRYFAVGWSDCCGNLWLFGGNGFDGNVPPHLGPNPNPAQGNLDDNGKLNDVWKYNTASNQWTWIGGSNTWWFDCTNSGTNSCITTVNYGPSGTLIPGGREFAASWTGVKGKFWLYGGVADVNPKSGNIGSENLGDMWKYRPPGNPTTTKPDVKTMPASPTTVAGKPGVILKAIWKSACEDGTIWFTYGEKTTMPRSTPKFNLPPEPGTRSFTQPINNLKPNTTYYFQVWITTTGGTASGTMLSFKTLP